MSSVQQLEGIEKVVQKRFDTKAPTQLLNSPTFNNLDNRFESMMHLDNNNNLQYVTGGHEDSSVG